MSDFSAQRSRAAATVSGVPDLLPDTEFIVGRCPRGIGHVISSPASPDLIHGVVVTPFTLWSDDRGYFFEAIRAGCGPIADFPLESTQVSATLSYPGAIKAFHYHRQQTDAGFLTGALRWRWAMRRSRRRRPPQHALCRRDATRRVSIPGWPTATNSGTGPRCRSATSRFYDAADEGRIAYDDARINYAGRCSTNKFVYRRAGFTGSMFVKFALEYRPDLVVNVKATYAGNPRILRRWHSTRAIGSCADICDGPATRHLQDVGPTWSHFAAESHVDRRSSPRHRRWKPTCAEPSCCSKPREAPPCSASCTFRPTKSTAVRTATRSRRTISTRAEQRVFGVEGGSMLALSYTRPTACR